MKKFTPLFLFSVFILTGCLQESPEELDRLTKEDPVFKQMILARDQAHQQEHMIKEGLLNKKKTLDAQVDKLRAEYDALAKLENKKIEQLRASIETNRNLLSRQMELESASMEEKTSELEGYRKTMLDINKVLHESKGIQLSKTEKQKWEERLLMLSEKMRPLTEEIQELKLQTRLKKQKIRFLK